MSRWRSCMYRGWQAFRRSDWEEELNVGAGNAEVNALSFCSGFTSCGWQIGGALSSGPVTHGSREWKVAIDERRDVTVLMKVVRGSSLGSTVFR